MSEPLVINHMVPWVFDKVLKEHEIWNITNGNEGQKVLLSGLDLSGMTFQRKRYKGLIFENCNLEDCTVKKSDFSGASFIDCNLDNIDVNKSCFSNVKFLNCTMKYVDINNSFLCDSTFENCEISNLDLEDSDIRGSNLSVDLVNGLKWFCAIVVSKEQLPWLYLNKNYKFYYDSISVG